MNGHTEPEAAKLRGMVVYLASRSGVGLDPRALIHEAAEYAEPITDDAAWTDTLRAQTTDSKPPCIALDLETCRALIAAIHSADADLRELLLQGDANACKIRAQHAIRKLVEADHHIKVAAFS